MVLVAESFLFSVKKKKKFLNINQGVWQIVLLFNYFNAVHVLEIDSIDKIVLSKQECSDSFIFFFNDVL